ncbi:hypothetical protein C8K63_101459 [Pseudomonas sp. GV085]|nr:hypothetical protein C8K63_101459 [Pseudomonas sp. GV085]
MECQATSLLLIHHREQARSYKGPAIFLKEF